MKRSFDVAAVLVAIVLGLVAGALVGSLGSCVLPPNQSAPVTAAPPLKIMGAWPIDNGYVKRLHDDETGVTCWLYRESNTAYMGHNLGIGLSCVSDWMLSKPAAEKP